MQADLHASLQTDGYREGNLEAQRSLPGMLERMPKWLICIPLALQWLWLALRYQSLTLPTIANPAITAGGLMGEGKLEYFDGMGPLALSGVRVGATEDLNDSG